MALHDLTTPAVFSVRGFLGTGWGREASLLGLHSRIADLTFLDFFIFGSSEALFMGAGYGVGGHL